MNSSSIKYWKINVGKYKSYWDFINKSKLNYLIASSIWMGYVAEKNKWKKLTKK